MTADTLYLLVTCSMDPGRAELACQVADNLAAQDRIHPFARDLLVFDNASRHPTHLDRLPKGAKVVESDCNVGYWSAIHWVLANHAQVMGRQYRYLYVIESDLIHRDMHRLDACERFLSDHTEAGGVRTQEFSVRWRMLYNKKYRWMPFARRDAWVVQYNAITHEPVWFRRVDDAAGIWLTNFHSKLPALNRVDSLTRVFDQLAGYERVTELDFMRLYHALHPTMAVLDGGLFRMVSSAASGHLSGSYSSPEELAEAGYHNTRIDRVVTDGFTVTPGKTV